MKQEEVTATKKINGVEYAATVPFDIPEGCDEMKEEWGDSIAVSNATANARVSLQGAIRRRIEAQVKKAEEAGETPSIDEESIRNDLAGYKPGEAAPRKDPVDVMLGKFQSYSPEKQQEILDQLKQRAAQS